MNTWNDRPAPDGGRLAASWQIGDHVQVSGDGERYAAETPLRATFYGISADGGSGQIAYFPWDASTAVAASVRRLLCSPTATTASKRARTGGAPRRAART